MNKRCGRLAGAFIILLPAAALILSDQARQYVRGLSPVCSSLSLCLAAENAEIFTKDIAKQKEQIEREFEKLDEALSAAKLQDARSAVEVVEYKIARMKKNLTKQELEIFRQRIEKKKKTVPVKEDSLVSLAFELMKTKGVDAALSYTQNDLRTHGVAEKKVNSLEKKILKDAPAIQQDFEREEIARVIKILESGGLPDSSVNPYILKSARMIMNAKTDSIQRVERTRKLKEMVEQELRDGEKMEKEFQRIKEKKKEEERLARMQRNDDDNRAEEHSPPQQKSDTAAAELPPVAEHEKRDTAVFAPESAEKIRDDLPNASGAEQTGTPETREIKNALPRGNAADTEPEPAPAPPVPENPESGSVKAYLQTLKTYQRDAQEKVLELYGLLETHQSAEALEKFKQNRGFIARHVDARVFTLLEQTIMQIVLEAKSSDSLKNAGIASEGVRRGEGQITVEQERLNKINGFIRDNKVEAAYAEFKRSEKQLKRYMDKNEFKQFKKMVENSYKTRHPGN